MTAQTPTNEIGADIMAPERFAEILRLLQEDRSKQVGMPEYLDELLAAGKRIGIPNREMDTFFLVLSMYMRKVTMA